MTSSREMGSSKTGLALAMASRNPSEPAILKLISEESTEWNLPSNTVARTSTTGNPYTHLVLRGGNETGPNFGSEAVGRARALLRAAGLAEVLMIDCSHGNSEKDPQRQLAVIEDVLAQRNAGESAFKAVMIESHLVAGRQSPKARPLAYGQSITDACLGFEDTHRALERLAESPVIAK